MYKEKKILAIIPARGGSKRIKNKNIKPLNGKPLISYSIATALKCKYIDEVIVSTDSKKISEIAKKYKAEIPFLRPKNISQDKTPDQPVLQHALNFFEKQRHKRFDYVIYLRPTTPLKKKKDLDNAVEAIIDNDLEIVRSVTKTTGVHHPYWMYKTKNQLLSPLLKKIRLKKYFQSQLLPDNIVNLNGVVDIFSYKHIMKSNFLLDAEKMGFIEIPDNRSIDIDEQIDFDIAELLIKKIQ